MPPRGRDQVVRPRVDRILDRALEVPLTLVSAPAGSGKTRAITGWLESREITAGWVSLEASDNDPAAFWASVAAVLDLDGGTAMQGPGRVIDAMRHQPDRPRLLVLDDYHVIQAEHVHEGLDALVSDDAVSVHVVVGTRHHPPLALARLRAAGALHEVRFDELRFQADDIAALLNGVLRLDLAARHLDRLLARTEGWAVGVQLAGLALCHHADRSAFVEQFGGDDRHVADYVRDEVIAPLPDDLRRFVLDTALLDHLSAPLCEAVTGRTGAQHVLEELERRNLFIAPLDHRRRWYRYHHLFAEWLRARASGDEETRHRRAAEWCAAHGLPADAVEHFLAAGDGEAAADVVEHQRWMLIGRGRQATLAEWIRRLPAPVHRSRPRLILASAWIAYDEGRWDDVDELVARAQRPSDDRLTNGSGRNRRDGHGPSQADDEGDTQLFDAEIAHLTAGRLAALGRLAAAGAVAARALPLTPCDEPRARSGLLLVLGKSLLDAGDLDRAQQAFVAAESVAKPIGLTIVELIARSHLADITRRRGRRAAAEAMTRSVLGFASRVGLSEHPECAVAHLLLGMVLLDTARIEEARPHIEQGRALAERIPYVPRATLAAAASRHLDTISHRRASASRHGRSRTPVIELTEREQAVLRLLPTQLTMREIADELYVSLNTVKTHTRTLYRKLGVRTRHSAIEQARVEQLL